MAVVAGFCIGAALAVSYGARADETVVVPLGIEISARLTERLSSQDAKTGQVFHFETAAGAMVGGIDVPERTPGHGIVSDAASAKGARPGKLTLRFVSLDLSGGRSILVAPAPDASPLPEQGKRSTVILPIPVAGALLFGGVGRSTNVVLDRGTPFTVMTVNPTPKPTPS
jgi:hypothetical protein